MQLTLMLYSLSSFGLFLLIVLGFAFIRADSKAKHRGLHTSLFDFISALVVCICYLAIAGIGIIYFFSESRRLVSIIVLAVPALLGIWCVVQLLRSRFLSLFLGDRVYITSTFIFTLLLLVISNNTKNNKLVVLLLARSIIVLLCTNTNTTRSKKRHKE